jgi:hypothetical protein
MRFLDKADPRRVVWEACCCPLEQMLSAAMFALLGCRAVRGQFHQSRLPELAQLCGQTPKCFVFGQQPIGNYLADFLLLTINPVGSSYRRLIVEAGKPQHVADIEVGNHRVMRFSGTAIHYDAREVIDEIKSWVEAGGCSCDPPDDLRDYSWILAQFTPSRAVWDERARSRNRYWEKEMAASTPDFVDDEGIPGYWRDTV